MGVEKPSSGGETIETCFTDLEVKFGRLTEEQRGSFQALIGHFSNERFTAMGIVTCYESLKNSGILLGTILEVRENNSNFPDAASSQALWKALTAVYGEDNLVALVPQREEVEASQEAPTEEVSILARIKAQASKVWERAQKAIDA